MSKTYTYIIWAFLLFTVTMVCGAAESSGTSEPALHFPRDHGNHPEFKTEWWYFCGRVADEERNVEIGFHLAFFRRQLLNDTTDSDVDSFHPTPVLFSHLSVSVPNTGYYGSAARLGRPIGNVAGAARESLLVWVQDWEARAEGENLRLTAQTEDVTLRLRSVEPITTVLHGNGGSVARREKPSGASYYYSIPFFDVEGHISVQGESYTVRGECWMDHEFFQEDLLPELAGWDWFCLRLDEHQSLMVYLLRRPDGTYSDYSGATLIVDNQVAATYDARKVQAVPESNWRSGDTDAVYPVEWSISIPEIGLTLKTRPVVRKQEVFFMNYPDASYYEGLIAVEGSSSGQPITGWGYMELVGYAGNPFMF